MTGKSKSAFPILLENKQSTGEVGMTLREYFAAHCPESWMKRQMPSTVGDVRDTLIAKGIIPHGRVRGSPMDSYDETERTALWIAIRYDYADAMLAGGVTK